MTLTKPVLFDTNVLVYNQDKDSSHYDQAHSWHKRATQGDLDAVLSSQNLLEFVAVMTSPKHLTKPLTQKQVIRELEAYQQSQSFDIIYPNTQTVEIFIHLLNRYRLRNSRQNFDIFLVATMLSNNITQIVTLNTKDFVMFGEIEVVRLA